ncbi:MAG: GNAT family protein [Rhodobacteraceae bacterium]|nr:GNAT family protein [Paracoccaceae bacterium]
MRFLKSKTPVLNTDRLRLRLPETSDYAAWAELRESSREFLEPWEPTWSDDHLTRDSFLARVSWAETALKRVTGLSFLMIRRDDDILVGGITLDQMLFGPSQSVNIGYWVGEPFARQGYMTEALRKLVHHCFTEIGLSRIEAACLPSNSASCGLLEKTGFKYEGVAQSYLQIAGYWRSHVLYANLRSDRRGRVGTG